MALLPFLAGSQPIRFAVHRQALDVMGEPVNCSEPRTLVHSSNGKFDVTSVALRS